jgi:tetratricopeptide (TPR) repeat protein
MARDVLISPVIHLNNTETMKQVQCARLALIVLLMAPLSAFTQKNVVSAFNANQKGKFLDAAGYIELALENPKAVEKEKTWRYRGDIYMSIAADSLLFASEVAAGRDPLAIIMESYTKADALDIKGRYEEDRMLRIAQAAGIAANAAISHFNVGMYKRAGDLFIQSNAMTEMVGGLDTLALFNSALCYEKANMNAMAIQQYMLTGMYSYQVPDVFLFAANLYKMDGDTASALAILQGARGDFPREQAIIIEELNIYLMSGQFEKAEANLTLAAEQDPTNEILWYSLGTVYDNLDKTEQAAGAYAKAIAVKPDYFDANFNLGAMYFNQAVKMVNEANDLWKPRMSKSEAAHQSGMETDGKALFAKAKPFLEVAMLANPTDIGTLRSLRDIYARTGEDNKLIDVSARIKELGY